MDPMFKFKLQMFWNKYKILVGILGAVAVVVLIFIILIITGIDGNKASCKSIGLESSLETCVVGENSEVEIYDQIVIVAGNTANSPVPVIDDDGEEIKKAIMASYVLDSSTNISVISATPNANTITKIKNKKQQSLQDSMKVWDKTIPNALKTSPTEDGADYLNAIMYAKEMVEDAENPLIIITGSGLSDSGLLNFASANDLLHMSADEVVSKFFATYPLKKTSSKNKIEAIWVNIGKTVEPQENLHGESDNLKQIYKGILKEMGIDLDFKATTIDKQKSVETNGKVVKTTQVKEPNFTITFDETQVSFVADKAIFNDEAAARNALQQVVDKQNGLTKIKVKGYVAIARCGDSPDVELSQERADAVKELLVQMGVPENKIVATGEGVGPVDICNVSANDLEKTLQQNRIVVIEGV